MGEAKAKARANARLVSLGYVSGDVLTTTEQIAMLERHVEAGEVEQLLTLALVSGPGPGLRRVLLSTMGAPLEEARRMLELAMESIDRTIGRTRAERAAAEAVRPDAKR